MPFLKALQQPCRYDRDSALYLIEAAKGLAGQRWAERRMAVLLLEHLVLQIPPNDFAEFDFIFVQLGIKTQLGFESPLAGFLLKEGYSKTELQSFVPEFLRRLGRLNRVHERIKATRGSQEAWEYLLRVSRQDCKLTLARYLFTPAEVATEICSVATTTRGANHTLDRVHRVHEFECSADLSEIPAYEREILQRLCANRDIYWVSEQTSSQLNSLVEYPLTSAVLVVKAPGSDYEFEFKRAGALGPRKLDVIYTRNGKTVPVSHRLHGGSLGWLGRREANSSSVFSRIYELVHGEEAPTSRTVQVSSIVGVPTNQGERHILDYLTNAEVFGHGFDEMRHALRKCVKEFPADTEVAQSSFTGDKGETLQFMGQAQPQQAILFNSSSYRLDRIALYLSDSGPEEFFRNGLGHSYTRHDAFWLADTVLEEILGSVIAPLEDSSSYTQYVQSIFDIPENRQRADAAYLSVMEQIGECWGTLLGVRGYSDGESFVLRNVGLKSQWKNDDWRVRVIFMDHDDLAIAGKRFQHFWPLRAVPGMMRDQVHILGGPLAGSIVPGESGMVAKIYRAGEGLCETGLRTLKDSMSAAYHKTQAAFRTNEDLRNLFFPDFIERLGDFDKIVANFLEANSQELWKEEASEYLKQRGYPENLVADYLQAIPQFKKFFERTGFLYSSRAASGMA